MIKGEISLFNAQKVKDECVEWIRKFFEENGKVGLRADGKELQTVAVTVK